MKEKERRCNWPWIEAIRACLGNHEPDEVAAQMKGGAAAIAEVVPVVAEHVGDIPGKRHEVSSNSRHPR